MFEINESPRHEALMDKEFKRVLKAWCEPCKFAEAKEGGLGKV
jgi:hypothetical protein